MMIMSFFETTEVLPFVNTYNLLIDGHVQEMTVDEQNQLQQKVLDLFEDSRTVPALGVIFDDLYHQEIQNGRYISLRFDRVFEVNELPFDELVFRVDAESQGVNLMRGMNGVFDGRCIYVNFAEKDMTELNDFISSVQNKTVQEEASNVQEGGEAMSDGELTETNDKDLNI